MYRPNVGRYIDRRIGRASVDISADIPVDISVDISTDARPTPLDRYVGRHRNMISRPICRSTSRHDIATDMSVDIASIGRYVDQHIGRGVRKLHMILSGSFSNATDSFFPERKKSPSLLTLQKVFLPLKLDRSFLFSSCGNAILALKASFVRFTFSRNSVVHKNFSRWIYLSLKGFA